MLSVVNVIDVVKVAIVRDVVDVADVRDLGLTWADLRLTWADLGLTWADLGLTWADLGRTWADLGGLGLTWADLGLTWAKGELAYAKKRRSESVRALEDALESFKRLGWSHRWQFPKDPVRCIPRLVFWSLFCGVTVSRSVFWSFFCGVTASGSVFLSIVCAVTVSSTALPSQGKTLRKEAVFTKVFILCGGATLEFSGSVVCSATLLVF